MKNFKDAVYAVVRRIPVGKVLTYKEVAQRAGRPKAYRAVGNILNKNFNLDIPCHRVVRSDGKTGGYNRGAEQKRRKLLQEGAVLVGCLLGIGAWLIPPTLVQAATTPYRPVPIKPEHTRPAQVRIWNPTFTTSSHFAVFDSSLKGGGYVAAGDIDGDGKDELILGSGPQYPAQVRIYTLEGSQKGSFFPYPQGFRGGVRVAAGDVDGDGKAEMITAPGPGLESRIHIFDAQGKEKIAGGALAYTKSFIGGVHLAIGDVDGDGKAEIITAPGPGGGPHVRIFNGQLEDIGRDFFAYDSSMTDGVTIATIKTPTGMRLVTGVESWAAPLIKQFRIFPDFQFINEFLALSTEDRAGVTVGAFDLQNDGFDEIALTTNGGSVPQINIFDGTGIKLLSADLQDPAYRGAFSFAQLNNNERRKVLATMTTLPIVTGPWNTAKSIEVSLSEQRLYAYEHGRIARTFLVSTGINRHPTPIGKTTVKKKIPIMDYRWNYGPNNPDNYFLPHVKYNLNIFPAIFIHSAYWHNNFGNRMSHGCVNTSLSDAEWIYNWADVGTPVDVHA